MTRIPWPRGVPYLVLVLALLVNAAARELPRPSLLSDTIKRNTLELENGKRPATALGTRHFRIKPVAATFPTSRAVLRANIMHR